MKYEYEYIELKLTEEQKQLVQMGMGNFDHLIPMMKDLINSKAKEGWEPLYPFSVPFVWFKREIKNTQKPRNSKTKN